MHSYKINFQFSTEVKQLEDDKAISLYGFSFVPFPDISSRVHDDTCLVGMYIIIYLNAFYASLFNVFERFHFREYVLKDEEAISLYGLTFLEQI